MQFFMQDLLAPNMLMSPVDLNIDEVSNLIA
jgi:hypothetical protein